MTQPHAMPQHLLLFPTHVLTEPWAAAGTFGPTLREAVLARRAVDPQPDTGDRRIWRSGEDMLLWGGEAARALHDHVVDRIEAITHDKGQQGDRRRFRWQATMAGEVVDDGASSPPESHPGAYWSVLYHVDDGYDGSSNPELGGEITFLDPRYPMIRMRTPDLRYRQPGHAADDHGFTIRPASGELAIFPGWLAHGLNRFQGPGPRVAVAMHLSARLMTP